MDKTKDTIRGFLHKSGNNDTTVHEQVNPAVKHETVKPTTHEEVHTAVEKEVHQDHYHHTVQPVKDKGVMPEDHHHRVANVQTREFDHRNHDETKRAVAAEAGKHHDTRDVASTTHTQSAAPTVQGEHVHHHVHETIQPVIHKETIQPKVVHTTVPVHETHHLSAKHHGTTELPPVSINEFRKEGGTLGDNRTEHFHHVKGEPNSVHETLKQVQHGSGGQSNAPNGALHGDYDKSGNVLGHHGHNGTAGTTAGPHESDVANKADPRVDSDRDGRHNATGVGAGTTGGKKHGGLLDKLNPKTDSNGDGKAGFLQ